MAEELVVVVTEVVSEALGLASGEAAPHSSLMSNGPPSSAAAGEWRGGKTQGSDEMFKCRA